MASDHAHNAMAIPIVDAHQHFWDLDKNYYPWLCDPVPIPFRYGDYSTLRRNYLPPDYRRDSAPFRVVKTVHMEAAWDRADPVAETRWIETIAHEYGLPSAYIGHAEPSRRDIEEVLAGHAKSPLVRGIRHKPRAASDPCDAGRGARLVRQERLDGGPFVIGEFVAHDSRLRFESLNHAPGDAINPL